MREEDKAAFPILLLEVPTILNLNQQDLLIQLMPFENAEEHFLSQNGIDFLFQRRQAQSDRYLWHKAETFPETLLDFHYEFETAGNHRSFRDILLLLPANIQQHSIMEENKMK